MTVVELRARRVGVDQPGLAGEHDCRDALVARPTVWSLTSGAFANSLSAGFPKPVSEDRQRRGLVPSRDELGPAVGFWLVLIVVLVVLFVLGGTHLL